MCSRQQAPPVRSSYSYVCVSFTTFYYMILLWNIKTTKEQRHSTIWFLIYWHSASWERVLSSKYNTCQSVCPKPFRWQNHECVIDLDMRVKLSLAPVLSGIKWLTIDLQMCLFNSYVCNSWHNSNGIKMDLSFPVEYYTNLFWTKVPWGPLG